MFSRHLTYTSRQQSHIFQALTPKKPDKKHNDGAEKPNSTILIEQDKVRVQIPVQNILFIKSEHVYCRIFFTNDQQILQRISLEKLLVRLPQDGFLRVHRSYIINVEHVKKFSKKQVFIGETVITIGRTWREQVVPRLKALMK